MNYGMRRIAAYSFAAMATAVTLAACVKSESGSADSTGSASSTASSPGCAGDNGGITLPAGFCATVFADTIGHARHIVVSSNGDVYVNTWSGRYYDTPAPAGGFVVALRDTNNDGRADIIKRFGPDSAHGNGGGTGIGIFNAQLYVEESGASTGRIVRYTVSTDSMTPTAPSQTIVSALPLSGDHPMHPFAIGQ